MADCHLSRRQGAEGHFGPGSAERVLRPDSVSPKRCVRGRRGRGACLGTGPSCRWVIRGRRADSRSRSWPFFPVMLHGTLIKNANAVKQWGRRRCILWTFFLFTETEIIEEFTEPVAVETTEVGLILHVFVLSLDYSFKKHCADVWVCFFLTPCLSLLTFSVCKQTVPSRQHLHRWWEWAAGWVDLWNRGKNVFLGQLIFSLLMSLIFLLIVNSSLSASVCLSATFSPAVNCLGEVLKKQWTQPV